MGKRIKRLVTVLRTKDKGQIKWLFVCLSLLALSLLPFGAQAEETDELVQIQVVGEALMKDDNLPAARELAVADGLIKAVEQIVGALVYSETQVENYVLLKDSIRLRSAGYVTGYEIIDTWTDFDLCKVLLTVTVRKGMIIKDLDEMQLIIQRAGDPRVMVVVTEREPAKRLPVQLVEAELMNSLAEAGYRVVNDQTASRAQLRRVYAEARRAEKKYLQQLAAEYQTDLLVLGEASTVILGQYHGLVSARASLQAVVVKVETGEVLTVDDIQETGVDLTEVAAAENALRKAGEKIAARLQKDLALKLATGNEITVYAKNISYHELLLLQKELQNTHLVSRVDLREFSERSATLTVVTALLAPQLAEAIAGWQACPAEITRVSNNLIELIGR